ncbi:MAG: hypothetical protein LBG73_06800 [Spirochaetaceae bacterium]|nr:hypothetical protein [Spirochaetaceae bacterium]
MEKSRIILKTDIVLRYDPDALDADRELFIRYDPSSETPEFRVCARKDRNSVGIDPVRRWVGLYKFHVGVEAGGIRINRELVLGLRSSELTNLDAQGGIRDRKQRAMRFIMSHGEAVVNRAMAVCEVQGTLTPTAEGFLRLSLSAIDDMEDCADFHLAPLLLFMVRYKRLISADMREEITRLILKFRYWIDEPGNDAMWYFSENHAFLFHVSQYLAGWLFPEEVFSASGRTGAEQSAIGRERVEGWFTAFFRWGFAEWNSATYIPIDLLGFFVLYETAPDETIRSLSKSALDYAFKIIAYNSFNGVMSCSYGRAYEHTLKSREQVETSFLEWIAYGSGYVNFRTRSAALFSLSSYEPPPYHQDVLLGEKEWMSVELDQGMNQVKTYSYRTADFFIAGVRRFKPFRHGHQQHLMNAALGRQAVQFYINHPGEPAFSGENRPSYWAGNGTIPFIEQYRGLSLMIFNIDPEELVHYIHGYTLFYDYDEYKTPSPWLFFRCGRAFCAVWWSNGYEIVGSGANAGKEVISRGLNHGAIIRCGNVGEWASFNAFCSEMSAAEVSYNGERELLFRDPRYGLCSIAAPDSVVLNGVELEYLAAPEMRIETGFF